MSDFFASSRGPLPARVDLALARPVPGGDAPAILMAQR